MGNSEIPSSKIEVQQVVSGFGANMDLAEINKLFNHFDAHGDGLITSPVFTRCLRAHRLDLSEEEEFVNMMMKMDLHSDGFAPVVRSLLYIARQQKRDPFFAPVVVEFTH